MDRGLTISEIIDDLRVADEILRRYERLYWLSSDYFYELYSQGLLDNGDHLEDFSEWAGYYKLRLHRLKMFDRLSRQDVVRMQAAHEGIRLRQREPVAVLC